MLSLKSQIGLIVYRIELKANRIFMRKLSPLIFLVFFATIFTKSYCQTPLIAVGVQTIEPPSSSTIGSAAKHLHSTVAQQGTYQIMHVKGRPEEIVPQSIMNLIESYRADDRMIYMKAGENTWIKILPYNMILAPGFKPVPNDVYTDESLSEN